MRWRCTAFHSRKQRASNTALFIRQRQNFTSRLKKVCRGAPTTMVWL
ncbi:hypothetical protein GGR76_002946 [Xanthomonas translucens]|nr:hypothetical protein [Xanthomonas campestris]